MPEDGEGPGWPHLSGRLEGGTHVLPVRVYYEDTDFSSPPGSLLAIVA
jgi:acyl-CoA thioester hydrolase